MKTNTLRSSLVVAALFGCVLSVRSSEAFFDDAALLRAELATYEQTNAVAVSNVVARLDALTGPLFSDVSNEDWFNAYVTSLAEWGIVSGYRNRDGELTGLFQPANPVTVAEVLKMATQAAKVDTSLCPQPLRHSDAQDHWARPFVGCAEAVQLRLLDADARLALDRAATRAEVLTIVHDMFGQQPAPIFAPFNDTREHAYEGDIGFGVIEGIVSGDVDAQGRPLGTFRPDAPINRAEVSKIIFERLKLEARKDFERQALQ